MQFRKFTSIENSYREKFVREVVEQGYSSSGWVVSEKIHGANLSFWVTNDGVRIAARNQFVDETFYDCGEVVRRYEQGLLEMKRKEFGDLEFVVVYGELYGPGIQKGIFYGKRKDFAAFELAVLGDPDLTYTVTAAKRVLNEYGIPFVPILHVCDSLEEALRYPNDQQSVVALTLNGCDPSEVPEDNVYEGVVIVTESAQFLTDGSRVILKNKNEKWLEKSKQPKPERVKTEINTHGAEDYVNANRLGSVVSKMGEVTPCRFGEVLKAMSEDVLEDMIKDGVIPENWRKDDGYRSFGKALSSTVASFLKTELFRMV